MIKLLKAVIFIFDVLILITIYLTIIMISLILVKLSGIKPVDHWIWHIYYIGLGALIGKYAKRFEKLIFKDRYDL